MGDDDRYAILSALFSAFLKTTGVEADAFEHDLDVFAAMTGYSKEEIRPILKPIYQAIG